MKRFVEADEARLLQLLPSLRGELTPDGERALRERLARDPALAAAWERLQSTWNALEPPPATPVPAGFSGRVMARVREQAEARAGAVSWAAAPTWVRATCAAALLAGVVLGAGLGTRGGLGGPPHDADNVPLIDSYWTLVNAPASPNEPADSPVLPPAAGGEARR